jgi:sRNA-binding protein
LRERWPQAFPRDYRQVRPLAIGINKDIAAHLPEQPLRRISFVIGIFQHLLGPAYYRAVIQGGPRYDLGGNPRGEVSLKEQEQARRDLHAFYERRKKNAPPNAQASREDTSNSRRG